MIMKKITRIWILCLCIILLFVSIPVSAQSKEVSILFTHDLHSYIDPNDQNSESVGGFARIKTIIDQKKSEDLNTMVLDAGDFSMGTLYQSVFSLEAIELRLLGLMGFDATTLGNHEFDYGSDGLSDMLSAAIQSGDPLPRLVESNIDWQNSEGQYTQKLKETLEKFGSVEYFVLEKGNVKAAIFGLMGESSASYAPTSGLTFFDISESAKKIIETIKKNEEGIDIIIALSHSGTDIDKNRSEDEILAKNVPGIDVIISGHSHTYLEEPIVIGDTLIVSAGEYGKKIGELSMKQNDQGRWQLENYSLIPINDSIPEDPEFVEIIENFKDKRQEYLDLFGFDSYDQVLAKNPITFTDQMSMFSENWEQPLGNLISDAYRYIVKEAEGENYIPVTTAIVPLGVIRTSLPEGDITVEDVYSMLSLGNGPDHISGYPLVSVYLTGAELKSVAEIDASVSPLMNVARLYWSGISSHFNPNRMLFNRVVEVKIVDDSGNYQDLEDDQLYRIVTGLYSARMLGAVEAQSFGLLKVKPKDAAGNPITDFDQSVLKDQNGREIKEWFAVTQYLASFAKENGISVIPDRYAAQENRKVVDRSKNIFDLIKKPNKIFVIVLLILILLVGIIYLLIRILMKVIKRLRRTR
jgi:2',3'-cyclic-nucleotide 2'-phosphodiesterase (5'-nucleotidase family)